MSKVLSVRQPWATLLFSGKPIENRTWATNYRGRLLIHASAGMMAEEWTDARLFVARFDRALSDCIPMPSALIRGAIIGEVNLVNCFRHYESPWFQGPVGWMFEDAKLWDKPVFVKGQLGLWEWEGPTP